jgi:hypothetical protein
MTRSRLELGSTAQAIAELAATFGNRMVTSQGVRQQHGNTTAWIASEPPEAVIYPQSPDDVQPVAGQSHFLSAFCEFPHCPAPHAQLDSCCCGQGGFSAESRMKTSTKVLLTLVLLMQLAIADVPGFAGSLTNHPGREVAEAAAPPASGSSPESLREIASWLTSEFGLSIESLPAVEFVAQERLTALRYRGLPSDYMGEARDILAVYDDDAGKIYLRRGWTGRNVAEVSILVHEMVHHAQNLGKEKAECLEAREKLAYEAQERWLRRFGTDLEKEFGINGLTLLVRTSCGW